MVKDKFFPWVSVVVLSVILLGCMFAEVLMTTDPTFLDLQSCDLPPCREFLFGTDPLGRDIFSGIWYGGRISVTIGFLAAAISTFIAILYGTLCGLAPGWLDRVMMRFLEVFLSIPSLLLVLFLQAILGKANVLSLSFVIGITLWPAIARVVRTEVRQLRSGECILAAKAMGCGWGHILRWYLVPNFLSSICFMVVMNVGSAIAIESTLSFLGMGLPLEVISWGSMLSLAQKALLTGSWWIILIPGAFLIGLLMCLTSIGNALRRAADRRERKI